MEKLNLVIQLEKNNGKETLSFIKVELFMDDLLELGKNRSDKQTLQSEQRSKKIDNKS